MEQTSLTTKTNDDDYRKSFYRNYTSTHVSPRAGRTDIKSLESRFPVWDALIGPYLPEDRQTSVVDLGCGSGQIVYWLFRKGYINSVGVDCSEEEVALAREMEINVLQGQLTDFLSSIEEKVGFAVLRNVLEHHHKHEIIAILRELRLSLRNNGKVFIQVPNGECPFFGRLRYGDFTHEQAFTSWSLRQLLVANGYRVIQVGPVGPFHTSILRKICWRIVRWIYSVFLFSEIGTPKNLPIFTQDIWAVAEIEADGK